MGGAVAACEAGYMKRRLVESNAKRLAAIELGEQIVVGVNKFIEAEPSPLGTGEESIITVDPAVEGEQVRSLNAWRTSRDNAKVKAALAELAAAAREGRNIMEPSIACAHAGVTTGEWAGTMRQIFGEYRAPTGVAQAVAAVDTSGLKTVRTRVETLTDRLGRRIKMLVGKPGLDGHSNGAEQIALRARDAGFEVVYEGIRLTPEQIVSAALEEGVHVVGLSILSGSHVPLVTEIMERMRAADLGDVPVVVGGIIPPEDALKLRQVGVARVYTPKDFDLNQIMADIIDVVEGATKQAA
jgi:(2R)-ethylmalonyl-CoA mutase